MNLKILCLGNQWRGSDDGSLFKAFSRAGHFIDIIDDKFFIPTDSNSIMSKVFRNLGSTFFINDYNRTVKQHFDAFKPDLVCVYKGASLEKETIVHFKKAGIPVICIYPDVSHFDHGSRIPECIPEYDFIFHTKSFGVEELRTKFNFNKCKLIQHCADPDIHRPINVNNDIFNQLKCEASFIGTHSSKKEKVLDELLTLFPTCQLKIWGSAWERVASEKVGKFWQQQGVLGDMYAAAINSSEINLGILSEASRTTSSGDRLTSRTFHIPGCGGFLLHERTDEFLELFDEDVEATCYSESEEMADKIRYYLRNPDLRKSIARKGYDKVVNHHTSDHRVKEIVDKLSAEGMI